MARLTEMRHGKTPDDEAIYWFVKTNTHAMTAETKQGFEAWLNATLENKIAFNALKETDDLILNHGDSLLEDLYATELEQEAEKASKSEDEGNVDWFKWSAIAATLLIVVVGASWNMMMPSPSEHYYETQRGGSQEVALNDGSVMHLNTNTKVHIRFDEKQRHVDLIKGEAIFEVTKNPNRPFIVKAGQSKVTVLGTKFMVRRRDVTDDIYVIEGKVNVGILDAEEKPIEALILVKGNQAIASSASLALSTPLNPQIDLAWREGWLRYHNTRLEEVVNDLNRYLHHPLLLEDDNIANLLVTAQIPLTSDREMIKAIQVAFNLKVSKDAGGAMKLEENPT